MLKSADLNALLVESLNEKKALHVESIDVRGIAGFTDFMIIGIGNSDRQLNALAEQVIATSKGLGQPPLHIEGQRGSSWLLVDVGDVVVHLMLPEVHDFYRLDKLWKVPVAA